MKSFRGYPVRVRRFAFAGRQIELLGPANFDDLINTPAVEQRFEADEYLPYWAEFWPACLLLASAVEAWPAANADAPQTVLELGCGLGLPGLVAAARGYRVICSDYDEDALAFVEQSAWHSRLPTPELRFVDWRERYADLRPWRILGAEILYEARSLRPIADFLAAHLAPGGEAWLSDARRSVADEFLHIAAAAGMQVEAREQSYRRPEADRETVGRLMVVRRRDL